MLSWFHSRWSFNALREQKQTLKLEESFQPGQRSAQCFSRAADQYFYCNSINHHYSYNSPVAGGWGVFGRTEGRRNGKATEISCRAVQENLQTEKKGSVQKKSRELAFLWFKLEWKSLVYWSLYLLRLISITSITSQPGLVNSSHMD